MIYVMFGNQRHSAIYGLRKGIDRKLIMEATDGDDKLQGFRGPLTVVRLPEHIWKPTTWPCEKKVKEVEDFIKRMKQMDYEVIEEEMAL